MIPTLMILFAETSETMNKYNKLWSNDFYPFLIRSEKIEQKNNTDSATDPERQPS